MTGEPTLTYVYAVAVATPGLDTFVAALRGVGDAPVTVLSLPEEDPGPAAPAFVTSEVAHADWHEEALRVRFEDLAWLEATARAHHHVIQALSDGTTILPLRMATLYQDRERALAALREQRSAFAERLALLAHHAEYGVKVYVRPDTGTGTGADGAAPAAAPPAAGSPGKAYLQARKRQHHAREDRYQQAARAAERIAAAAAPHATHAVRHPTQAGPLARGESGENVLNDAYLVPEDRAEAFRRAVERAGEDLPGVRVDVTGPWAPYSFAMPEAAADASGGRA
ncbi:GvpL/GvpF family gas vesicle protein [Streptomyces sp. NRRL F-2664]|uniref:GvpL/GvpF family gas vesicle protein n=1 Tax=Streptomyces sp. NRRL F-2664 TaxID=1463842 RepID=UPI0005B9B381|nr:GvpL/GvpF family gas vesicle protein [Streptomyces sp. NRRL F-2664]